MKNKITQFAAAFVVAIFTAVTIFSMTAKSDTAESKMYKTVYEQAIDSNDGAGGGIDSTDGKGGPQYPPDPNK